MSEPTFPLSALVKLGLMSDELFGWECRKNFCGMGAYPTESEARSAAIEHLATEHGIRPLTEDGADEEKLSPENLINLLDFAWTVIKAGGMPRNSEDSPGWTEAAERFRDQWHEVLRLWCAGRSEVPR